MENYITLEDLKDFEVWKSWRNGGGLELEPLYSEEEVENILIEYVKTNPTKPYRVVTWFQQFKRKN